jgi:hypothetical protein
MVPCDVSQTASLVQWWTDLPAGQDFLSLFGWSLAPRVQIVHDDWSWHIYNLPDFKRVIGDGNFTEAPHERFVDYFLLRGLLYKWKLWYGKFADEDSYVWNWFPDGQRWLSEVRLHGLDVLEKVLKPLP